MKDPQIPNSVYFKMAKDEEIINAVIEQIKLDVEMQDVEALDEFLRLVINIKNKKYFIGYLSEETQNTLELNDDDND